MRKYSVRIDWEPKVVLVSAKTQSEARRKARERFHNGTIKPKIDEISAEEEWI